MTISLSDFDTTLTTDDRLELAASALHSEMRVALIAAIRILVQEPDEDMLDGARGSHWSAIAKMANVLAEPDPDQSAGLAEKIERFLLDAIEAKTAA